MAFFELNALSTILGGSFSARVFLPEMDKLWLDDGSHTRTYPVLWLLHDEGNASVDWQRSPAEQCAADAGIFIIAPDVQHALGTNMVYGPQYENFMYTELHGICRNLFPIASDPEKNWIGGTGTGAYGAVKIALKHPDVFSKAFSLSGVLDLGKIFERAVAGEPTGIHHHLSSLKAVFGDPEAFAGSENDLWALAKGTKTNRYLFVCEENDPRAEENRALADSLRDAARVNTIQSGADMGTMQVSLPKAVKWACEEEAM